jgi:glycosyltransferase involved in cell wall biosynthesis
MTAAAPIPLASRRRAATPTPQIAMYLEQALGHVTHGMNIEHALAGEGRAAAVHRIEFDASPRRAPWAVRASIEAWRRARGQARPDVSFFHTQTVALLAPEASRGRPYVISVDATPLQMDELGRWYDHGQGPAAVEGAKRRLYRRVFSRAAEVVAWSDWARDSLVTDYGVAPERIHVLHPGAPDRLFAIERASTDRKPTLLFVGGDFPRKGGNTLLEAFAPLADRANLVLMTGADVPEVPGVRVLRGVGPESPEFLRAFAEADVFCLPTLADCTPVAIGEAFAAGLPVVTTNIASNPEVVPPDAGLLVPPGDAPALRAALERVVDDAQLRNRMAGAARDYAQRHLRAGDNARAIIALLDEVAVRSSTRAAPEGMSAT